MIQMPGLGSAGARSSCPCWHPRSKPQRVAQIRSAGRMWGSACRIIPHNHLVGNLACASADGRRIRGWCFRPNSVRMSCRRTTSGSTPSHHRTLPRPLPTRCTTGVYIYIYFLGHLRGQIRIYCKSFRDPAELNIMVFTGILQNKQVYRSIKNFLRVPRRLTLLVCWPYCAHITTMHPNCTIS